MSTMRIMILLLAAAVAQCAVLTLPSGFEGDALQLNVGGPLSDGWTVTPTIDVVGPGSHINTCANGSQRCLDMTGTSGSSGSIFGFVTLVANQQYTVSFWLSGSQRNLGFNTLSDTVEASVNGVITSYTMAWDAPWQQFSVSTIADPTGVVQISFAGLGDDNVGLLLDDVSIQGTPEPATYALCGTALILLAGIRRKR